jgi:hypothetical protein
MLEPPLAIAHADASAKHVSFAEVSSFSKTIPKDVGSGSLRNTQPVANAQTSSLATGHNVSSLIPAQSNHVQTYGQADTSKSVETAQMVSRHNVTNTESQHYHTNATQKSMSLPFTSNRPQPNLMAPSVPEPSLPIAHTNASSRHGPTTEPSSFLKNIPRDEGSTSLRGTLLASNAQTPIAIGQKVPLTAQNQSNHAQTQVCQSRTRFYLVLKHLHLG